MSTSFIIHYLGWQAAKGFGATGRKAEPPCLGSARAQRS
jgi:hypothetical protein